MKKLILLLLLLIPFVFAIDAEMFTAPIIEEEMYIYPVGDEELNIYGGDTNVTAEEEEVPRGTGGGRYHYGECNLNYTNNISFDKNKLSEEIIITNLNMYNTRVRVNTSLVPTFYGLQNLLETNKNVFYLQTRESDTLEISLKDIKDIRENTTVFLDMDVVSFDCPDIQVNIYPFERIFYDLRVKTDKLFYFLSEIVNISVLIENKGIKPDKDTVLKIFLIDPNNNKTLISEETIFEPEVGITELFRELYLYDNYGIGKYKLEVEYDTEQQEVLRSSYIFYVLPTTRHIFWLLIILIIIALIFPIYYFLKNKNKS